MVQKTGLVKITQTFKRVVLDLITVIEITDIGIVMEDATRVVIAGGHERAVVKVQLQLDSNLRTHHNRAGDQSSSLLTGLIEDGEGNRFTPSFTVRRGRRYRYYVSQPAITSSAGRHKAPTRLPAHEVESRVRERIQEFLKSDAETFNELSAPAESPALMQHRVTEAKKLAARLPLLSSDDVRGLLALITQKVIINENNIQLMIRRTDLVDLLEKGEQVIAAERLDKSRSVDSSDTICLTIETRRKQYGGEVHLVVPPNSNVSVSHPRSSLIKAVVRGHAWYEKVLEGKVVDLKSLAREAGVTPQYVRNIINCAFLAPDIVEAILEGRQPLTLRFANLYKPLPMSWAEQRRQFGFPQDSRS